MHNSEPRANPTLIDYAIKVYEFKQRPLGPIGQYWLPQNPILKLIQHFIIENQLYSSTLCNYQNTLMHNSEPRANPTLIDCAIKVYKFKQRPLGPIGQYWLPQNPILKLIQHFIIENQLYSSTLCK